MWLRKTEVTFRIKRNPVLLASGATLGAFTGTLKRASETLRRKENSLEPWGDKYNLVCVACGGDGGAYRAPSLRENRQLWPHKEARRHRPEQPITVSSLSVFTRGRTRSQSHIWNRLNWINKRLNKYLCLSPAWLTLNGRHSAGTLTGLSCALFTLNTPRYSHPVVTFAGHKQRWKVPSYNLATGKCGFICPLLSPEVGDLLLVTTFYELFLFLFGKVVHQARINQHINFGIKECCMKN